jgi:oxygen-independent coproporphyrinogen-3 oxidase
MGTSENPDRDARDPAVYFARVSGDPLRDAFTDARRAHPPAAAMARPADRLAERWEALLDTPRQRPGTAYVHVPFCETHCLFCGFYQNPWRADAGSPYVDRVIDQIGQLRGRAVLSGPPLRAVYLGGGTPTALAAGDTHRLVVALREHLPLAPDCEITLEGRAWHFTEDRMRAAFEAGVNRVSLGVQTFDTAVRRALGRRLARPELLACLERLLAADAAAIVIDLIYGLPRQTHETWATDLQLVTELGLDGVDLYGLIPIGGTPLLSAIGKGKLAPIAREDLGGFYAAGSEALAAAGWTRISTSHWQSPSLRERSVYNFMVKGGADCFAFGAGAGGSLHGVRHQIVPDLAEYQACVLERRCPAMALTDEGPRAPLHHAIRAGMERARLDPLAIAAVPDGAAAMDHLEPLLGQWCSAGLLHPRHRFHDLTVAGCFWQVSMTRRIFDYLNACLDPPTPGDRSPRADHRSPEHAD